MTSQSNPPPSIAAIEAALRGFDSGAEWVDVCLAKMGTPDSLAVRAAYARAQRKLGQHADSASLNALVSHADHWSMPDWGRLWLLQRAFAVTDSGQQLLSAQRLFEGGELGEQVSFLRTLRLLPEPARFQGVAVSACRTNATEVFEAIVCENPYPAEYFPQLNFNQLVMKAVFMEVELRRVVGLSGRVDRELVRMARDFESELKAAGRVVPEDLKLIRIV